MDTMHVDENFLMKTHALLRYIGATNTTGIFQTAYAVALAHKQPCRLLMVTKWLYPSVAKHYGTAWACVERNVRYTIASAWKHDGYRRLAELGYVLPRKPRPTEFIHIILMILRDQRAA